MATERYNPQVRFKDRINSFKEGIDLLIDFAEKDRPAENSLLSRMIDQLHENLISELEKTNPLSFKSGKEILQRFIQGASRLFSQYTDLKNKNVDKIFKLIVTAEKYAIWAKVREPLPIKSEMQLNNKKLTVTQIETPRVQWTDAQKEELLSILDENKPDWFLKLNEFEQWYIADKAQEVKEEKKDINKILFSIPSSLRNIFGLANYSEHQLQIKVSDEKNNETKINSQRVRSAVIVPIDLLKKIKTNQDKQAVTEITKHNIEQLIAAELAVKEKKLEEEKSEEDKPVPILLQTLLSDGPYGLVINHERDIVKYKNKAAKEINDSTEAYVDIIPSNIPINKARKARYGGSRPEINEKIVEIAENSKKSIVQAALTEYKDNRGTAGNNYNLFKASLEQIIIDQCGGISYGSCKSGKDRKGMETLHTDAMLVYYATYGVFPRYSEKQDSNNKPDNSNRKKFIDIFVELYFTYLQHEMADQNAPGSFGIKSIEGILPKDILNAIKEKDPQEIENNKKYSSLNRIKKRSVPKKLLEQDEQLVTNILKLQEQRMECLREAKEGKYKPEDEKLKELQNKYNRLTQIYDALREKELLAGRPLAYHRIDTPAKFKEIEALGENWLVSLEKTLFESLKGIKAEKFSAIFQYKIPQDLYRPQFFY